jgi:hypothetical protein
VSVVHVRVVDGANGEPVAGAVVTYVPRARLESEGFDAFKSGPGEHEGMRRYLAAQATTDASGVATLAEPLTAGPGQALSLLLRVDAEFGGLWGALDPGPVQEGSVVVLAPREELAFVVTDASGRTCPGTEVCLEVGGEGEEEELWSGATDDAGRLVLPHLSLFRRQCRSGGELRARCVWVGDRDGLENVPFAPEADSVVELRGLPTGAFSIDVVDARGRPVEEGFVILQTLSRDGGSSDEISLPISAGRASALGLLLGRQWRMTAYSGDRCSARRVVPGPRQPGEVVTSDLVLERPVHWVHGRLFGPDGTPCAYAFASLEDSDGDEYVTLFGDDVTTDGEGRFTIRVDPELVRASEGRLRIAVFGRYVIGQEEGIGITHADTGDHTWMRELVLDLPLNPGANELGDVVLEAVEVPEEPDPGRSSFTLPD